MNHTLKIIKELKLDTYLTFFLKNNTAITAPYHNLFHSFCVASNCYLIAQDEKLDTTQIKELVIAGLFHDFNHSQGKLSDEANVKEAIKQFEKCSKEDKESTKRISRIIEVTQYPYVIPNKDLSLQEKIIRDADMLQPFEKNYIQQVIVGLLMEELDMTMEKALDAQIKFMKNMKAEFNTEYSKKVFKTYYDDRMESFEYLKTLI